MCCNRKYTWEYIPEIARGLGRGRPCSVLTLHGPPRHTPTSNAGHSTQNIITRLTCILKVHGLNLDEHIEIFNVVHSK